MCDSNEGIYSNNMALLTFNTWLVEQPEFPGCGYVAGANNHRDVSTTLWWAGPHTDFQERVLNEARSRGIKATIIVAKYSKDALDRACGLISGAGGALAAVNFAIALIIAEHDGLTVEGFDPAHPGRLLGDAARAAVRAVLQGIHGLEQVMDLSNILIEHGEKPVML